MEMVIGRFFALPSGTLPPSVDKNKYLTDNSGNLLIDNHGNYLTYGTYTENKYLTYTLKKEDE